MFTTLLPRLFCKPENNDLVFSHRVPETNGAITIRSLDIDTDLPIVYKWVNAPYAEKFWQMNGPYEELKRTYEMILAHSGAHSFVGLYNDQFLCQADIYMIGFDELREHLPNDVHQCGIHIITAPPKDHPIKKLSLHFLISFLSYYFSFPLAERLYGEPDYRNEKVHLLIKRAGFSFIKQIQLSQKTANLFCIDRNSFLTQTSSSYPSPPHLSAKLTSSPKGEEKEEASPN